jgi:hypothetical protein
MPIQKRWTSLSSAAPPEEYGIYEFGIRKDGGSAIVYIGRARQGATTIRARFKVRPESTGPHQSKCISHSLSHSGVAIDWLCPQEHVQGRGNKFVYDAISNGLDVVYRCLEADGWTDPATMEVAHLQAYQAQHGELPPGNAKRESLPSWWVRARVVIGHWAE